MSMVSSAESPSPTMDRTKGPGSNVQARARRFIVENFYVSDPASLAGDTSLINTGLVDSTGMLEVIAFLESEYGIRVEDREMVPANLETIDRIAAFVARKRPA
jgi:acyl carrier protein